MREAPADFEEVCWDFMREPCGRGLRVARGCPEPTGEQPAREQESQRCSHGRMGPVRDPEGLGGGHRRR